MNAGNLAVRFCLAVALTLIAFAASAKGVTEMRKQAEASMLLTGTLEVALDGSLRSYQLDHQEKIDPAIRDFVESNIKSWTFTVDSLPPGAPSNATILNNMSILVVAKPVEGDTFTLRLAASNFWPKNPNAGSGFEYKDIKPPEYPSSAVRARVEGKVFLLVKLAPDGVVEDAIAEQVNLAVLARSEKEMERWRNVLATSALNAVKQWTFSVPDQRKQASLSSLLVRVPVEFNIRRDRLEEEEYGRWAAYIPGPRQPNPWEQADDNPGFAPDALAAHGGVYSGGGLRLKSPLHGTASGG